MRRAEEEEVCVWGGERRRRRERAEEQHDKEGKEKRGREAGQSFGGACGVRIASSHYNRGRELREQAACLCYISGGADTELCCAGKGKTTSVWRSE